MKVIDKTSHHRTIRCTLASAMFLASFCTWAQSPSENVAPALEASQPSSGGNSLMSSVGSFFDKLRTATAREPNASPPGIPSAAPAPVPEASQPSSGVSSLINSVGTFFSRSQAANVGEPNASSSRQVADTPTSTGAPQPSLKIVDITTLSAVASAVLDPECRVMVQPYAIEDNLASLAAFAGKLKLQEMLRKTSNQPGQAMDVSKMIKLAARGLNWMPMTLEVELGRYMLKNEEILDEDKNADTRRTYNEARSMLAELIKDLPEASPYNFQIYVRPISSGSASALPGGIILVDRDLFKKGGDLDYARFVISHEVAHILQRHQTRAYQARLADGIDSLDALGKLMTSVGGGNVGGGNPGAVIGYAAALKKLFVNFTEDQELQADSCAVRLLAKRYPTSSVLSTKLDAVSNKFGPVVSEQATSSESADIVGVLKFLGDGVFERHPHTGKRRGNLQHTLRVTMATK